MTGGPSLRGPPNLPDQSCVILPLGVVERRLFPFTLKVFVSFSTLHQWLMSGHLDLETFVSRDARKLKSSRLLPQALLNL